MEAKRRSVARRKSGSCRITREIIRLAVRRGACEEAVRWARRKPRTIRELVARNADWARWLAIEMRELPEPIASEIYERIGVRAWWLRI